MLASRDFENDTALVEAYFEALGPKRGSLIGDASPLYLMGDTQLVARRAKRLLIPSLKVICVLRDPIRRAVSHYKHVGNWASTYYDSVDQAFEDPMFTETSLYSERIAPWIDEFGREAIMAFRFEDYIANRAETIGRVLNFLGVALNDVSVDSTVALNTSEERYQLSPLAARLRSALRKMGYHKPLPARVKGVLLPTVSEKLPKLNIQLSDAALRRMQTLFERDGARLRELLEDESLKWDLGATVEAISNTDHP